jgi:hypothetical protein
VTSACDSVGTQQQYSYRKVTQIDLGSFCKLAMTRKGSHRDVLQHRTELRLLPASLIVLVANNNTQIHTSLKNSFRYCEVKISTVQYCQILAAHRKQKLSARTQISISFFSFVTRDKIS